MTTERWIREVPGQRLRLDDVTPTQRGVWIKALLDPSEPVGGDELPHVVNYRGRLYLEDGHTRWTRQKLLGREWFTARVYTVEDT